MTTSPSFQLTVLGANGSIRELVFSKPSVLVGRIKSNDIVILGDSAISREHCQLDWDPTNKTLTVKDLGSSNGSFLNGAPVDSEPITLEPGDQVQVGATVITYSELKAPEPATQSDFHKRLGVPLPPQSGENERTVFDGEKGTCGRCGGTIDTTGLLAGDKVGCTRCRAVWKFL